MAIYIIIILHEYICESENGQRFDSKLEHTLGDWIQQKLKPICNYYYPVIPRTVTNTGNHLLLDEKGKLSCRRWRSCKVWLMIAKSNWLDIHLSGMVKIVSDHLVWGDCLF